MKDDDEGDYEWLRRTLRNRARRNFPRKGFAGMAGSSSGLSGAAEAASWAAAVVVNSGTVSAARQALVSTLIGGLKTDGVWTKLDRLWLFAAENSQSALTDLSSAHTLAAVVAAPTFTIDRGYAGNGTTSYVNTTFNPATQGTNFTLNSASLHNWSNTSRAASNAVQVGCDNSTNYIDSASFTGVGNLIAHTNEAAANFITATSASSIGFFTVNRSAAGATQAYQNGASLGSGTDASSSIPSFAAFVGSRNDAGTAGSFSSDQISAAALGGSFSAGDAANFYTRMRTYMTAVGVT